MKYKYPKAPIPFSSVVIITDNKVLLVRRGEDPWKGSWSIPGNAIRFGETMLETLLKGVKKETGIAINAGDLLGEPFVIYNFVQKDKEGKTEYHLCFLIYKATTMAIRARDKIDKSNVKWIQLDKLKNHKLAPEAKAAIKKLGALTE